MQAARLLQIRRFMACGFESQQGKGKMWQGKGGGKSKRATRIYPASSPLRANSNQECLVAL